jgi:hypothetical protein
MESDQTVDGESRPGPLDPGVLKGASRRWDGTLDKTLRAAVVPYGYTVTTWATGAYLVGQQGLPSAFEAFIFVCGAIIAFALLSVLSARRSGTGELLTTEPIPIHPDSTHPIFVAGFHIVAIGVAFAAAALLDALTGNVAWFLGSFVVTLIYLALSSFEIAIAIELHRREFGLRRARVIIRRRGEVLRDAVRRR